MRNRSDPGDLFVNAYMAVQAGEKAEQAGNFKEAISKFRYAAQVLDQISERHPAWQPPIIDYRKKRTAEAIGRMQDKVGATGTSKPPATAVAPPAFRASRGQEHSAGTSRGNSPDDASGRAEPARTTPPTRRPVDEPDLPASTPAKEVEQRMEKMRRELEKVRAEAARAEKEKMDLAAQLQQAAAASAAQDKKQAELDATFCGDRGGAGQGEG